MIEELTPQVLMISMFLIIMAAPLLTLLLCVVLLWMYRRIVTQAMAATGSYDGATEEGVSAGPPCVSTLKLLHQSVEESGNELYLRAIRAPWRDAKLYAVAVLAAALLFSAAAQRVYPYGLGLPGFFVGVWIYVWPLVLSLPLIVPDSMRLRVGSIVVYVTGYSLLGLWASTIANVPGVHFGEVILARRSSVTPFSMIMIWLSVNAGPTILILLCFNRWVRAVAPLVLSLVTIVVTGAWFGLMMFSSPVGADVFKRLDLLLNTHAVWFVLLIFILFVVCLGVIGWVLARWIARAYRQRRLSDRSLILDALWLVFACTFSMWLVVGGLAWIAMVPVAFIVYKLVLAVGARIRGHPSNASRGLTFLRVFSLRRRSEALIDAVAKYWRHVGSVQMITGPDVAGSTVQPHQFLDFLSGKISGHFVGDRASLARNLAERDFDPDPDGRFRVNSLFCHADSWQAALPQLVQEGDTVLMDLRSFSTSNAGCIHELLFLAAHVPFHRCLFVVDDTTDESFLNQTLRETSAQLPQNSPNYGHALDEVTVHHYDSGATSARKLVQQLCDAAGCPYQ